MKKIITSKITLFTALAVAVLFLGLYVYMIARPIAYGMKYEFSGEAPYIVEEEEISSEFDIEMTFHMNDKVSINNKTSDFKGESYYYYQAGYIYFCQAQNEEEYNAEVKEIKADWDNIMAVLNKETVTLEEESVLLSVYKINAFELESQAREIELAQTCNGTIIFTVIGGVVELLVIGLAVTSFVIGKKTSKKEVQA